MSQILFYFASKTEHQTFFLDIVRSLYQDNQNKLPSQISNKENIKGSNWEKKIEGLKLRKGHELPLWLSKSVSKVEKK